MERALILWGVKGAIVIGAGLLLAQAMARASAAARHLVLCSAVAAALLLPAIGAVVPALGVDMPRWAPPLGALRAGHSDGEARPPPSDAKRTDAAAPSMSESNGTLRATRSTGPRSTAAAASYAPVPRPVPEWEGFSARGATLDWVRLALLLWASAALALLSRAAWGWAQLAKAARTAKPVVDAEWRQLLADLIVDLRIARRVQLLQGDEPGVPVTWGVVKPCILLPVDASTWPKDQRRAVLLHELAHVERLDALTQLAASISCALHWPNPLAWLAARRMHLLRERACDDRVLFAGARPSDYATSLLDIARSVHRSRGPAAALAMARKSQLEGRLVAVLDPSARRSSVTPRKAALAAAAAATLALPIAALESRDAVARDQPAPAARESIEVEPPVPPAPAAPAPPAPPAPPARPAPPPPRAERRTHTSTSIHSEKDGRNNTWTVSWTGDDGRSTQLHATGEVSPTQDLRDFALAPGAMLDATQREPGAVRMLTLRADGEGRIERALMVNGRPHPWDAEASAWLASFIEDVDRHTAFAAKARVQRMLEEGGPDRVLSELDRVESDYAKGIFFKLLLDSARLDTDQLVRALRSARAIHSDYELANVLNAITDRYELSESRVRNAFLETTAALKSDYELGRVLQAFFAKEKLDDSQARAVLAGAARMKSDYEKANVLVGLATRKMVPRSAVSAYLETASTLRSDYEHARVLKTLAHDPGLDAETLSKIADQTGQLHSEYEAASTLVELSDHRSLAGPARAAYLRAAESLRSEFERNRALAALIHSR